MPRQTTDGATPAARPPKRRKRKPGGIAKASKESAARTRKAQRAIRAGDPPPKRTTAEEIVLAERRLEALDYAKAGHSYAQIGRWLDPPCSRQEATVLVKAALLELQKEAGESADQVRVMQLQRLDEMLVKPLENAVSGDVQSVAAVLKIMERQAALVGADAPKKQEVTGKDGGPVENSITIRRIVVPVPGRDGA